MLEPDRLLGVWSVNLRSKKMAASNTDSDNSHEVLTFAQHASTSGQKGQSRSFPCSFCGREFRNAQALGGHMNVHRRERNLARDLMQLRNHGTEPEEPPASNNPPVQAGSQDVITQTSNIMQGDNLCAGSSSSSSSPPSQASISFANSLGCSVSTLLRRDSVDRAVDLELRLGHTPDM